MTRTSFILAAIVVFAFAFSTDPFAHAEGDQVRPVRGEKDAPPSGTRTMRSDRFVSSTVQRLQNVVFRPA